MGVRRPGCRQEERSRLAVLAEIVPQTGGIFAIHPVVIDSSWEGMILSEDTWSLTHVPSGYSIFSCNDRPMLREVAEEFYREMPDRRALRRCDPEALKAAMPSKLDRSIRHRYLTYLNHEDATPPG